MIREDTTRLGFPKMEYYREVYKDSPRWNGAEPVGNKHIIVYCEQGLGDQIQFARYVPALSSRGTCDITLHCSSELLRLFQTEMLTAVRVLDRDDPELPRHDFHITSMSLPFALQEFDVPCDYLTVMNRHQAVEKDDTYKIGIAWEGNPDHSNNDERSCPLRYFGILEEALRSSPKPVKFFSIQKECHDPRYLEGAESLEIYGVKLGDMLDTARLINSMDAVVCVDTALLHLAGTLKKPTWALLSHRCDPRWAVKQWYDTVTLVRQPSYNDWSWVLTEVATHLGEITRV